MCNNTFQGRLDKAVVELTELTRSQAAKRIEEGYVTVNDICITKASYIVSLNDKINIEIPPLKNIEAQPENIPLHFYYEDEHIAVVEKPAGMVVHPACGNETGTLVNALLFHIKSLSGIGGVMRPGIVHRLDKDTSGIMMIAKSDIAHMHLSKQLEERTMDKRYLAVVEGKFSDISGFIDKPIARSKKDRKKMDIDPKGKSAQTEWECIETLKGASLLNVHILTGRTHQIRVHMKSIGHPVVGDPIYGLKKGVPATRLLLHAHRLTFTHPISGETLTFVSPMPSEFLKNVEKLRLPVFDRLQ